MDINVINHLSFLAIKMLSMATKPDYNELNIILFSLPFGTINESISKRVYDWVGSIPLFVSYPLKIQNRNDIPFKWYFQGHVQRYAVMLFRVACFYQELWVFI